MTIPEPKDAVLNPDDLKRVIIDGIQSVLDHPFWYRLTTEQKKILQAQGEFWRTSTSEESARLYAMFAKYGEETK